MTRNRILSLLVCAALLAGLLAGCTSTSGGSSASASGDAASSESIPASTAQADTGKLTSNLDEDENSIFSLQNTEAAFAPCLGWGPGVSGCSLKSVQADAIQDAYTTWFNDRSADDQASFADAWPLIKEDANTLLTDKASMEGRISDAGLNAKKLPGCSKENWNALQKVVDALVPQSSEY